MARTCANNSCDAENPNNSLNLFVKSIGKEIVSSFQNKPKNITGMEKSKRLFGPMQCNEDNLESEKNTVVDPREPLVLEDDRSNL